MKTIRAARQVVAYVWSHPANSGKRARSLGRAVRFRLRGLFGWPTLTTIGRDGKMFAEVHRSAASKVLYSNPPDWAEMHAWRRLLKPGDLFIDVGSNVGSYALWVAEMGVDVIAVEPDPEAVQRLRRNVALNPYQIEILEIALAERPGQMLLTSGNDCTNHLILESGPVGTKVKVDTLDRVVGDRRVGGVKIDVEGAERLVLAGAARALAERRVSVLQLEWNRLSEALLGESREPTVDILREHGYEFARPDGDGWLRPADPADYGPDIFAVADGRMLRREPPT